MGWKRWVRAYFGVLFSRELWFSWYFVILEVLMFLGLFQDEHWTTWYGPLVQAGKCLLFLFVVAIFFTSMGCVFAAIKMRDRQRVERETAARMAYARAMIDARIAAEPVETPKQRSPWYLGAWAKYLDEGNDKRN